MLSARALGVVFLLSVTLDARDRQEPSAIPRHPDPVVARLLEHIDQGPRPLILFAERDRFERAAWNRVRNLVAFRVHRPQPNGLTVIDAPIYLVRESRLYQDAAAALRNRATVREYVWCQLAALIAHEAAHTGPETTRGLAARSRAVAAVLVGGSPAQQRRLERRRLPDESRGAAAQRAGALLGGRDSHCPPRRQTEGAFEASVGL